MTFLLLSLSVGENYCLGLGFRTTLRVLNSSKVRVRVGNMFYVCKHIPMTFSRKIPDLAFYDQYDFIVSVRMLRPRD